VSHCSQRLFWQLEFPELDGEKGWNFAGWSKKLTGATTISVGSVGLATSSPPSVARVPGLSRKDSCGRHDPPQELRRRVAGRADVSRGKVGTTYAPDSSTAPNEKGLGDFSPSP